MDAPKQKLIHIAEIKLSQFQRRYLLLRQTDDYRFVWYEELRARKEIEKETPIWGGSVTEAVANGKNFWSLNDFSPLNCGFRYTLPERDEVGTNALFHQMAASYISSSGIYFDEELGSNCIVQNAPTQTKDLLSRF